jgi:uncharacterized protein
MKLVLNTVAMSLTSILLMTVLTLGITKVHAQTGEIKNELSQESLKKSQQELIDLFFAAAKTGNQEVINEFLKNGFPVDVRNSQGYTALMMAAYYGQEPVVDTLMKYGADRCARDNKGNTALMGAIFKLEWGVVKQLRKVDCDANAKQTGQKTVAEFAKVIGQEKKLQEVMKK